MMKRNNYGERSRLVKERRQKVLTGEQDVGNEAVAIAKSKHSDTAI
jgi:hypothetical protein